MTRTLLVISFLSVLFSLYLFEGYLVLKIEPQKKEQFEKALIYEKQTGRKYDRRSRIEIYYDLKKTNKNIQVTLPPNLYINKNKFFPLSGISNSKTIYCSENGYYAIYQSDRYGFNNPDNEWIKNEIEYLLVGDSFPHGACVNRPNDIASVLRVLSNKSVINLAYDGNGPLTQYAVLREYLKKDVKTILWFFYEGNDLGNLAEELNSSNLTKYIKDLEFNQNLKARQNEINKIGKSVINQSIKQTEKFEKQALYQKKKDQKLRNKILKFIRLNQTKNVIFNIKKEDNFDEKENQKMFKKVLELADNLAIKNSSEITL